MNILWILGLSELISILCLFHLWRQSRPVGSKLVWSVVLFLPVLGPILYGTHDPPETLRNPTPMDQQLDAPFPILRDIHFHDTDHEQD